MTQLIELTPNCNVSQLLRVTATQQLTDSDSPRLDAELLLAKAMGLPRVSLHTYPERRVEREHYRQYQSLIQRRKRGEPMAYLLGEQEFWSLKLHVTPAVLVPRPETETLVEAALQCIETTRSPLVLDLGTGSGAVALAIAFERPDAHIIATDTSLAALEVARRNALRLRCNNIEFRHGHWYQAIHRELFNLIVSNPPYIAENDHHLAQSSLPFEPRQALTSGRSGLEAIIEIIDGAPHALQEGGSLAIEHGYDQKDAIETLYKRRGFQQVLPRRDLGGRDRVISARFEHGRA